MNAVQVKKTAAPANKSTSFFNKESGQHFFHTQANEPPFFIKTSNHAAIQPKLTIGQPNDNYEKEADATADKVVQRLSEPTSIQTNKQATPITPFVQKKCAHCEEEEKLQKKELEDFQFNDSLQKKPIFESNIQRKCSECEKEEKLQKKSDGASQNLSINIESRLSSSKGSGSPLSQSTREQMENSFGANFSAVRIHDDSSAVQMSKDLNAQAFTHGSDIYFNSGKYDASSPKGNHLLAHELTHVVQQSSGFLNTNIQRDDIKNPLGPKEALKEGIEGYRLPDDGTIAAEDMAKNKRAVLLAEAEEELDNNDEHVKMIIEKYPVIDDYVSHTLDDADQLADSEPDTINSLISTKKLGVGVNNFYLNDFFSHHMDAFPESFLKIITPLIDPPYEEGIRLISNSEQIKQDVTKTKNELPEYFFNEGLPFNKEESMNLYHYELIKSKNLRLNFSKLVLNQPIFSSDLDFVTDPENRNLHTGSLFMYQSAWTNYIINLYAAVLYGNWKGSFDRVTGQIKRGEIDTIDAGMIAIFQQQYADGLNSIRDFFLYTPNATAGSAGITSPSDPATFYNNTKPVAVLNAATQSSNFIETEYGEFRLKLGLADAMVRGLSEYEKLGKSLHWSIKKGFAEEAIKEIIDNFVNILEDLLKEKIKKSVFERIVTFIVSLHPLGRLAVLAYEVYNAAQTVNDALDILSLIGRVLSTIDEAQNASTVIDVQRSAAKLAEIYKEVIPIIVQKISDALAKRLLKTSKKTDTKDEPADDTKASKGDVTKPVAPGESEHDKVKTPKKHEDDKTHEAPESDKDDLKKNKGKKPDDKEKEPDKIPAGHSGAHHAEINEGKIEICSHCKNLRNIVSGVIDSLETKGPDKSTRARLEKIRDKIDELERLKAKGAINDKDLLSRTNQVLADLRATSVKSNLDSLGLFREWESAKAFEQRIYKLAPGERVAEVYKTAENRATLNGWKHDPRLTKINKRDVYVDPATGDLYAVDSLHGRFEKTSKRGKHLGEFDMDLRNTKDADKTGMHDLDVK